MSTAQFVKARATLGVSVNEMAVLLNTDSRTVRRYEDGTRTPGGPVARLVEALLDGWRP